MGIFPKNRDLTQTLEQVELRVDASFFREPVAGFLMRLDHFLAAHLRWRSRSSLQELIKSGAVLVDGSRPDCPEGTGTARVERRPGRRLRQGSQVLVVIPEELRIPQTWDEDVGVEILYEDEEVVAVAKPPMIPVHPSGRYLSGTLVQHVHAHYREEMEAGLMAPRLCHRLDRETSGIVLLGKRARTHSMVMAQFEARSVEKEYLAIVWGALPSPSGTVNYPLASSSASSIGLKMAVRAEGMPCRTDWRRLEQHRDHSLVACELFSGRQHQIRVHMSAIGFPIVGDKLYGPDEMIFQRASDGELTESDYEELEMPRQALHNHRLVFDTPAGGKRVEVVSPLPADMREFLSSCAELE
ncbi:MAG: 23S rRNA pseudouridine1911/1915/1917 synthase [Planctomycetota bacterium]|jgi:23S rRNA pseudouridine1911/1915/1917 synthase